MEPPPPHTHREVKGWMGSGQPEGACAGEAGGTLLSVHCACRETILGPLTFLHGLLSKAMNS